MHNKILALTLAASLGGVFATAAQPSPKPYEYWPDTDTEWNKLTNHITWCFDSLRVRHYVATGEILSTNTWKPSLVCPFRDYLRIAKEIDNLASGFIDQSLAGEGDFESYFESTNNAEGCCPSDLPRWTPERLHSKAFGRTSWSINTALTAWMAVTNRAIASEVTAAMNLLQWTPSYAPFRRSADNWQGWECYGHSYAESFGAAAAEVNSEYAARERIDYFDRCNLEVHVDMRVGQESFCMGAHAVFNYNVEYELNWGPDLHLYQTNFNVAVGKPHASAFMKRDINVFNFEPADLNSRQRVFFCSDYTEEHLYGQPVTVNANPVGDIWDGCSPISYAGLTGQGGRYIESVGMLWLLKWRFPLDHPPIPCGTPVETQDTDRDDLVEILPVGGIPGSETGTLVLTHEDDVPNLYIPLAEPQPWDINPPLHTYLTVGACTNLPYHYVASASLFNWPDNSYTCGSAGHVAAFSGNTRIEEAAIYTNGDIRIKQALLIRPRGQAVIFDFPWEGDGFSRAGYPTGVNRDLGYVLWDYSSENDFGDTIALKFPSGVTHVFGGKFWGVIFEVSLDDGTGDWGSDFPWLYVSDGMYFYDDIGPSLAVNGRYAVSVTWDRGQPVAVEYRSSVSGELCESAEIVYEAGRAVGLVKTDPLAEAWVIGENRVGYGTGVIRQRTETGSRKTGRKVKISIHMNPDDSGPYWSEEVTFDARSRMVGRRFCSGSGPDREISYSYQAGGEDDRRCPTTGTLVRNLVASSVSTTPFGAFTETFTYTPDEGWLERAEKESGGGSVSSVRYSYADPDEDPDPSFGNNEGPQRMKCLRSATFELDGAVRGRSLFAISVTQSVEQVCGGASSGHDAPENIEYRKEYMRGDGFCTVSRSPSCIASNEYCEVGDGVGVRTQMLKWAQFYPAGRMEMDYVNAFGVVVRHLALTREWAVLDDVVTDVDGRGRPVCRRFMDGTAVRFEEYCLHGPTKIVNRDGSETRIAYDAFGRVKSRADGETGITCEYEYDPLGNVVHLKRTGGDGVAESFATYGLDGALLYSKDESGHEVRYAGQNVDGFLVLTRSETGRGDVTETYWGDGVLKSVSGPGAQVRFDRERGVTDNQLWIKETNAGNPDEWVKDWYAFNGLYAYSERPGGIIDSVEYDGRLNLKGTLSADGVKVAFSYDNEHFGLPSLAGVSLSGGETLNLASDPYCVSNSYALTPQGLKTTRFSFPEDNSGEPFEEGYAQVSPDGRTGTFAVRGREGSFSCDAPPSTGTYTKTVNLPDGAVETYAYRKFLLREVTRRDAEALRKVTSAFEYDGFGELSRCTTDEKGYTESVSVGRDAKGLVGQVRSNGRGATTFSRDGNGLVTHLSSSRGSVALGWLDNGLLGSVQNNAGPRFSREVDALGRDSTVTRLLGGQTSALGFSYGNDGGFGSKTRDGVQTLAVTSRRADGRPRTIVLPGGVEMNSTYDAAGRLSARAFADPADPSAAVSETYSWSRDGSLRAAGQPGGPQLSNMVFRAGGRIQSTKSVFDGALGLPVEVLTSFGGPEGRKDGVAVQFGGFSGMALGVGAQYDTLGHADTLSGDGFYVRFSGPAGGSVTNTQIAVGGSELLSRTVTWSASAGKPARVDYTLGGQFLRRWQYAFTNGLVASVARSGGDGYRTDYAYDGAGQLLSASSRLTSGFSLGALSFGYSYSAAGNTIGFGRSAVQNSASASGDLQTRRLWTPKVSIFGRVSANVSTVKVAVNSETNEAVVAGGMMYASPYVPAGNHTRVSGVATVIATPPQGTSDICPVAYSLPAVIENPVYNANGMVLKDSRRDYRWDASGRLTAVTNNGVSPAAALAFQYYPDGRRASKTVSRFTNGVWAVSRTLQYAWEGWKLAAECERDGAGNVAAVRHFVWGPDLAGQQTGALDSGAEGVGGLLLIREWKPARGVRVYLPISDGLGSVCALIDASDGSLAAEFDYDPYGTPVVGRGPAMDACPFRHRTRYYDPETWLYYYGYRYYDPSVTKWISKDPLGEAGGWNLTCFCDNDPVNKFDALGDKAYGNDYSGPLEWMDWVEKAYTQKEVDKVYAYLKKRDRHIYNPGLGNTETDRLASKRLLEKALGVPVDMAWNPTFRRLGDDVMNAGAKISDYDAPWYHLQKQAANLAGGAVWLAGGVLNVAGIGVDVGVAAVEKVPLVRTLEPTYQDSMRLYREALQHVMALNDPGAMVYGWMHSEGAIHGCAILDSLTETELGYVRASTFGAGSYLFRKEARVRHYGNIDKWGVPDFVPGIAALNYVRNIDDVHWKTVDRIYMHGIDSYVRAHLIDDVADKPFDGIAKRYFRNNTKAALGY